MRGSLLFPWGLGWPALGGREQKRRCEVDGGGGDCSAPLDVLTPLEGVSRKWPRGSPLSFLYRLCNSRPLSLAAGVRLLEILAEHVHMSSGSFINIRWGSIWLGRQVA